MVVEHQDWSYANGPQPLQAWLNEVALVLDSHDRGNFHFCCPRTNDTVAARLTRKTGWSTHAFLIITISVRAYMYYLIETDILYPVNRFCFQE